MPFFVGIGVAIKPGFWSQNFEKFVWKLPSLAGLREDLQVTMFLVLVWDSFLCFHLALECSL